MKLLSALLIGFVFHATVVAQNSAPVEKREFRLLTTVGVINELKFDLTPKQTVSVRIDSRLSRELPMPASGALVLYREIAPPPDSPPGTKPTKETVARINFPQDCPKAIVVIAKNTATSAYQSIVFDDTEKSHPSGMLRLFNLSGMSTALSINKAVETVTPGKAQLVPYPLGPNNIQLAVQRGSNWTIAFDKGRIARPNLRAHMFVFDYQKDPEVDDLGMPPPALVRFYTESAPSIAPQGMSVTVR